jgi:uncharacterized protein YerC
MSQVSKYPISDQVLSKIFETFLSTLTRIQNPSEADSFIHHLLTPTEKIMIAKRLFIALLLLKGYQYREISEYIKVSTSTVASVHNSIKLDGHNYTSILEKILRDIQFKEFIAEVGDVALTPLARSGIGSGTWRYLKSELKKYKKEQSL